MGKPVLISTLILCAVSRMSGQTTDAPAFEVATIKPNVGAALPRYMRQTPGRVTIVNMSVQDLVMVAYQVKDFQISGGPGWIDSGRYDIEAKMAGDSSQDQMKPMLQGLLRERFGLVLHRDTKELPIYELKVAKGGLKLQPLKEGACVVYDPKHPPTPGHPPINYCGNLSSGWGSFEASAASMADIARMFSFTVGRTVVDKTGVTGVFPVHLKYAPDDSIAGPRPNPGEAAPVAEGGPSFFTAVQEQLGLKLESGKGPVEVVVIDHAEKPSEN